jgi:hypothetical protein
MAHPSARLQVGMVALAGVGAALVAAPGCAGNLDSMIYSYDDGVAGAGGGMGGPGGAGGSGGGGSPASCTVEPTMLLKTKCAAGGCHEPTSTVAGGLDLLTGDVASRLVGVASDGSNGSKCGPGIPYLIAGSQPARGLLLDKLIYPPCGDPMPSLGTWSAANMACIQDWANGLTAP